MASNEETTSDCEELFKSDIREQFDELEEKRATEKSCGALLLGDQALAELISTQVDFDTGRLIGRVRVQTADMNITIICEKVTFGNFTITFHGKYDGEEVDLHVS